MELYRYLTGLALAASLSSAHVAARAQETATSPDEPVATTAAAAAATEAPPPRIPAGHFDKRPAFWDTQLSPDGSMFAYLRELNGETTFVITATGTGKVVRALLPDTEDDISWYRWVTNDKLLLSVSTPGKFFGDDVLYTGAGSNIIAYNQGGGLDTVYSGAGASNTLALGGGLDYGDLSLSREGDDLILNTGGDNKVAFKDWYAGNATVERLQMVLDGDYDAGSADTLYNRRVQTFDFLDMVSQFDAALAQSPGLSSWALTNALLEAHLASSDEQALGGDLAYWYGRNGSFAGISLQAAQQVIGAAGFGSDAQTLRPFSGLQEGLVKLS